MVIMVIFTLFTLPIEFFICESYSLADAECNFELDITHFTKYNK